MNMARKAFMIAAAGAAGFAGCAAYLIADEIDTFDRGINTHFLTRDLSLAVERQHVTFTGKKMTVREDFLNNGYKQYKNKKTLFSVDFAEGGEVCVVEYDLDDPSGKILDHKGCQPLKHYLGYQQTMIAQAACRALSVADSQQVTLEGGAAFGKDFCLNGVPRYVPQ